MIIQCIYVHYYYYYNDSRQLSCHLPLLLPRTYGIYTLLVIISSCGGILPRTTDTHTASAARSNLHTHAIYAKCTQADPHYYAASRRCRPNRTANLSDVCVVRIDGAWTRFGQVCHHRCSWANINLPRPLTCLQQDPLDGVRVFTNEVDGARRGALVCVVVL